MELSVKITVNTTLPRQNKYCRMEHPEVYNRRKKSWYNLNRSVTMKNALNEIFDRLNMDLRYIPLFEPHGGREFRIFSMERGILDEKRLLSFLEEFSSVSSEMLIIVPDRTEEDRLKRLLLKAGHEGLAESIAVLEKAAGRSDGAGKSLWLLTEGVFFEDVLDLNTPDVLVKSEAVPKIYSRWKGVQLLNTKDKALWRKQFDELDGERLAIPEFRQSFIDSAVVKTRDSQEYPENEINKVLETARAHEGMMEDLREYVGLYERLSSMDIICDPATRDRYVVFKMAADRDFSGELSPTEKRSMVESVVSFFGAEKIRREEQKNRESALPFDTMNPEEDFLRKYRNRHLREEVKSALEALRKSPSAYKLRDAGISFSDFFDLAGGELAKELVGNYGFYRNLKDTDQLALLIQDLFADRSLLDRTGKE